MTLIFGLRPLFRVLFVPSFHATVRLIAAALEGCITEQQLKDLLRPFGIEPHREVQADGTIGEIWRREDFEPVWRRLHIGDD